MIGVDISTNPWRLRKNSLQVFSISRFRPVPRGPRSMKPLTPPYISKEPQKKPLRLASSESSLCFLLAEGSAAPNLLSSVNRSRISIILYGSNDRRQLNEQNPCLSGLYVLDDGRPNFP